jgi:uncharacterized protein YndB with AHSA1/START domain
VVAGRTINAPPARVYAVRWDYQEYRPKLLPPAFSDFRIEEGGVGAGTVLAFTMSAGGRTRSFQSRIEEPEPGRVLREVDLESTAVTTFTVTPEGSGIRVRIVTSWQGAGGFGGLKERLFAPWFLRKLYDSERERLERYLQARTKTGDAGQTGPEGDDTGR